MSRRSIFKTAQIAEIKREMRNGTKVKEIAKRLAPMYNMNEEKMLTKLYYISAHTYMTKGRPSGKNRVKNTRTTNVSTTPTVETMESVPTAIGKKVEMYSDHIRIYF
jgi:hypothetical protein